MSIQRWGAAGIMGSDADGNVGIGIKFVPNDEGEMTVTSLLPGAPADESKKFFAGDVIVAVGGVYVHGKNSEEVKSLIVGKPGTTVDLIVRKVPPPLPPFPLVHIQHKTHDSSLRRCYSITSGLPTGEGDHSYLLARIFYRASRDFHTQESRVTRVRHIQSRKGHLGEVACFGKQPARMCTIQTRLKNCSKSNFLPFTLPESIFAQVVKAPEATSSNVEDKAHVTSAAPSLPATVATQSFQSIPGAPPRTSGIRDMPNPPIGLRTDDDTPKKAAPIPYASTPASIAVHTAGHSNPQTVPVASTPVQTLMGPTRAAIGIKFGIDRQDRVAVIDVRPGSPADLSKKVRHDMQRHSMKPCHL